MQGNNLKTIRASSSLHITKTWSSMKKLEKIMTFSKTKSSLLTSWSKQTVLWLSGGEKYILPGSICSRKRAKSGKKYKKTLSSSTINSLEYTMNLKAPDHCLNFGLSSKEYQLGIEPLPLCWTKKTSSLFLTVFLIATWGLTSSHLLTWSSNVTE